MLLTYSSVVEGVEVGWVEPVRFKRFRWVVGRGELASEFPVVKLPVYSLLSSKY